MATERLRVFISYTHDSPEHGDRVLAFANRLVINGIDVALDQYEPSPAEGWPLWMERQLRECKFTLMICTVLYYRRVTGQETVNVGLGVPWEGNVIYNSLYVNRAVNQKFIPVLFDNAPVTNIPDPLRGYTFYRADTEAGYEQLYRRLTDQPFVVKPPPGSLIALPQRQLSVDLPGAPSEKLAQVEQASLDTLQEQCNLFMQSLSNAFASNRSATPAEIMSVLRDAKHIEDLIVSFRPTAEALAAAGRSKMSQRLTDVLADIRGAQKVYLEMYESTVKHDQTIQAFLATSNPASPSG